MTYLLHEPRKSFKDESQLNSAHSDKVHLTHADAVEGCSAKH